MLYQPAHETIKLGADNPDNLYQKAVIDGRFDYGVRGERGSIDYISFATSKGSYAENFTQIETGFLDSNTIDINGDGTFKIVLSSREQPGNWLPMDEARNPYSFVRLISIARRKPRQTSVSRERIPPRCQPL